MKMASSHRRMTLALLCGLLGCVLMGSGDWLMIFGDTAHSGSLYWLTEGVAAIAPWRNSLAFPATLLYGAALFSLERYIPEQKPRRIYHYLTVFGLTPWLALHLFYVMILYLFAWLNGHGYGEAALPAAEALFSHLSWVVIASEALMLPPFLWWGWLAGRGQSILPRWMALLNPLTIYAALYLVKSCLPDNAFRIAFTNGLMNESMFLWFGALLAWHCRKKG